MPAHRIVSLLPSATEIIYELGVQDRLFGVTHECRYPADAASKPRITTPAFESSRMSCGEIDGEVRRIYESGGDTFLIDAGALGRACPDLIVCQDTCRVCAVHTGQLEGALESLPERPATHAMDPHSVEEILDGIVGLAGAIGVEGRGRDLRRSLESRISRVAEGARGEAPGVLVLEWLDPLFSAGHWVPEMIEAAGGRSLAGESGGRSRVMSLDEVASADPDIILLAPCGFDLRRTASEYGSSLARSEDWRRLRAVRDGAVYALDAGSYFSRPGTATVTGIEVLAGILRGGPDAVSGFARV